MTVDLAIRSSGGENDNRYLLYDCFPGLIDGSHLDMLHLMMAQATPCTNDSLQTHGLGMQQGFCGQTKNYMATSLG